MSQRFVRWHNPCDPHYPTSSLLFSLAPIRSTDFVSLSLFSYEMNISISCSDRNVFQLAGLDFAVPFMEEGESYLNFVKFQMSLRMRLLCLRDVKPYLFTGEGEEGRGIEL